MEIILSTNCKSLTGSLGQSFGYFIVHRGKRFFSQRSRHKNIPPDGHWRFILTCATLAQSKIHITDIRLHWDELRDALAEAHKFVAMQMVIHNYNGKCKAFYDARDIINLKHTFGL